MSTFLRDLLTRSTAFSAAAEGLSLADQTLAGDPSFTNNGHDPLLAGKELPRFKFALEKSRPLRLIGGSFAREATVEEFPISRGIAGVSMTLEPGAMRELHWHEVVAEWAYVNQGRVRTTVIAPDGTQETNDYEPGDVWYFPVGHGHMLECLGEEPCHFVLIFDNGHFSEFAAFSITDWIGHTPKALLAKNFGLPEATFAEFPNEEVYFGRGPIPPEQPAEPLGGSKPTTLTHKWQLLKTEPKVSAGGRQFLVDCTTFAISKTIAGAVLELEPGALRELHWHPSSDEWQYVLEGKINVTMFGAHGRCRTETLEQGDVGYIPRNYGHSIENIGDKKCRILLAFNAGVYESIDLSEWIARNPVDVLAKNFRLPAAVFERFPKKNVFVVAASPYKFDANIVNNSLAVSPDERLAVVSYSLEPRVLVYDLETERLVTTLAGFITPRNILFTPDGKHILISDSTRGAVAIVAADTLQEVATIPIGAGAFGTAIDRAGERLYVNNQASDTVTVVDLARRQPIAVLTGFSQPRQGVKLNHAGTRLYVTNFTGDKITVVDTASLKSVAEITGFDGIRAISITADDRTLYAANSRTNSISVVDLKTTTVRDSIPVGKDPYGAALSPDGHHVYSGNKVDNTLTVIDTATHKPAGTIYGFDEPRQAIVFARQGAIAYVLNKDLSIAVVDLREKKVTHTIRSYPGT